jgi:hypothetical protein
MSEQASLLLCNLASQHGLAKAREIIAAQEKANQEAPAELPEVVATAPEPSPSPEPEPVPVLATEPVVEKTPGQIRSEQDEGAKGATSAQLRVALDQLGIPYRSNAPKALLLATYLARP